MAQADADQMAQEQQAMAEQAAAEQATKAPKKKPAKKKEAKPKNDPKSHGVTVNVHVGGKGDDKKSEPKKPKADKKPAEKKASLGYTYTAAMRKKDDHHQSTSLRSFLEGRM